MAEAATNGVPMGAKEEKEEDILMEMQSLTMRAQAMSKEELQLEIQKLAERLQKAKTPKQEPRLEARLGPQSRPLQGMQENRAGGYSYVVDNLTKLKRYIVIGTEKSTYMATERKNPQENIKCVMDLINQGRGKEVIDTITEYAIKARVAKEENILIILRDCAMYTGRGMYDDKKSIQRAAYDSVVKICNIPTKLFRFLELCEPRIQQQWKPENKPLSKKQQRKRKLEVSKAEKESQIPAKKKKKKKKSKNKSTGKKATPKVKKSSSWGRMRRRGIGAFYTDSNKDANRLLLLCTKYKQRHNWSHTQVLGYAHPKIADDQKRAKDIVLTYCTRGYEKFVSSLKNLEGVVLDQYTNQVIGHIKILHEVQQLSPQVDGDEVKLLNHLKTYGQRLDAEEFTTVYAMPPNDNQPKANPEKKKVPFQLVREHIPTGFLKSERVWEALLQDMPMTALIRNLGKMTSIGLFGKQNNVDITIKKLTDAKHLRRARIHPVKVLIAMKTYEQGHGDKGYDNQTRKENNLNPLTWNPVKPITDALDKAFYLSFKQDENEEVGFKTGKKFMLALDVSGSMTWSGCYGCEQLTPAVASTALAMVTWNIEEHCRVMAFGGHLESLEGRLRKDMTVTEAMKKAQGINFGRTDCSLPMVHAMEQNMDIDVFVIYTDSDTWAGRIHPSEALIQYRQKMNKPEAKLLVLAMQSTGFSIADPEDPFMMDICGFDADVPDIIYQFATGSIS